MRMTVPRKIGSGVVEILVPHDTIERLAGTCFRGNGQKLAGNFFRWKSASELLGEREVLNHLLWDIEDARRSGAYDNSLQIDYEQPVGWSGTAPFKQFDITQLEPFNPNRRSTALRVRTNLQDLVAPQTSLLTIVYKFRENVGSTITCIKVYSIYPGPDVGELIGDVTEREDVVFFNWDHPGA